MRWLLYSALAGIGGIALVVIVLSMGILASVNRSILPGVQVAGIALGGKSVTEATSLLAANRTVTLSAGDYTWQASAQEVGLLLDAEATARQAYTMGRENGNFIQALFGQASIAPVVGFDIAAAEAYFLTNETTFDVLPINAGVVLVDGDVQATPAQAGFVLDIQATLAQMQAEPARAWMDGTTLSVLPVAPQITDVTPALALARSLLANPLEIRVYDPVTDDSLYWAIAPNEWGQWITALPDANSPIGMALNVQDAPLRAYLTAQAGVFDSSRAIDIEAGIASIQNALAAGTPQNASVIVRHNTTTHLVQPGETLTSIAWDYGMPYLYIQQVNGGRDTFSSGEKIVIPPADQFLLLPVVANKRIVVSIARQRVTVYENGQVVQDWTASTGIASSPTWKGIYQIISHEANAYAGNWDLYMPNFMGVYQPIPNADFTNGFHGFPTRGGGQLLWENSIGTRVTYGCILLSNANAQWLYDWAQEGVVVEITG